MPPYGPSQTRVDIHPDLIFYRQTSRPNTNQNNMEIVVK